MRDPKSEVVTLLLLIYTVCAMLYIALYCVPKCVMIKFCMLFCFTSKIVYIILCIYILYTYNIWTRRYFRYVDNNLTLYILINTVCGFVCSFVAYTSV